MNVRGVLSRKFLRHEPCIRRVFLSTTRLITETAVQEGRATTDKGMVALDSQTDLKSVDPTLRKKLRDFDKLMEQADKDRGGSFAQFKSLHKSEQKRIKIVLIVAAVWAGFVLSGAGIFYLLKPWMDKKRVESRENYN